MKRPLIALAAALSLAAAAASAQPSAVAQEKREASPFSPFVYEALGATPKIELRRAGKAPATPATAEQAERKSAARDDASAEAAADRRLAKLKRQ